MKEYHQAYCGLMKQEIMIWTAAKGVKYTYTIRSYSGSYLSYWNSVRSAVR